MMERKSLRLVELKSTEDGGGFEGLAAAFCNVDDSMSPDILAPGCFKDALPAFLAEGFIGGLNHDWDVPIGKPLEARETAHGLWIKAAISDTQAGRDARTLLRDEVIRKLSIGFRVQEKRWLEKPEDVRAWWDSQGYSPTPEDVAKSQKGVRLVTRVRLYEVSPVAVPANERAVIAAVKAGATCGCRCGEQDIAAALRAFRLAKEREAADAAVEAALARLRSLGL